MVQDIAGVICLHPENQITFDTLIDDLSGIFSYQIDSDQVFQNLQHLRRGGLVSVDWQARIIKREGPMKEYILKRVVAADSWSIMQDDWLKIAQSIQEKCGTVNTEFQQLMSSQQR